MISSGKTPDRKAKPVVAGHLCAHDKCHFFRTNKEQYPTKPYLDGATCFRDGKDITYYDGWQAHCEIEND